jgi:hypothetical protein
MPGSSSLKLCIVVAPSGNDKVVASSVWCFCCEVLQHCTVDLTACVDAGTARDIMRHGATAATLNHQMKIICFRALRP